MRAGLILALSLLPLPALAESPRSVGERLDMTSFPNSIGPRREAGRYSLADYGFDKVEVEGETVRFLEPDGSWFFAIRLLDAPAGKVLVCIEDKAENGGSYHVVRALDVVEGDGGLLVASADPVTHPDCAERQ